MTDVPKAARAELARELLPPLLTPLRHLDCDGGATRKTVWRLFDGATVASVLVRYTAPAPDGLGLSQRNVTVSTVGLVPAIDKLTAEGLNVTLAVSLHAPDDELRDSLVPVNTRWKVAEVLGAAWRYAEQTRRRVSIE